MRHVTFGYLIYDELIFTLAFVVIVLESWNMELTNDNKQWIDWNKSKSFRNKSRRGTQKDITANNSN